MKLMLLFILSTLYDVQYRHCFFMKNIPVIFSSTCSNHIGISGPYRPFLLALEPLINKWLPDLRTMQSSLFSERRHDVVSVRFWPAHGCRPVFSSRPRPSRSTVSPVFDHYRPNVDTSR